MDQYEFEKYLENQPKISGTEPVGRFVKNAFGVEEKLVLPDAYWRYVDWLVEAEAVEIERYIVDCDNERGERTLSENLMDWLYFDMTERKKAFHPLPSWLEFI
ncbi:hypothetical protein FIV00_03850 [Labrenzia sp. THAF82]|uniref:hypothetical protein n=1 Tax=Labrenzia sp. THAF82 TaxID=2587861 RepID=UPI001269682C|nr:hypothetical protein [Labrenzia sp. THAF82]QFT29603.1 hypothetical protein FIV00_03850 [Labrenzia sp. THAF82]